MNNTQTQVQCPVCGHPLGANHMFCPACGYSRSNNPTPPGPNQPNNNKSLYITFGIIISVLLLVLCALLAKGFLHTVDDPPPTLPPTNTPAPTATATLPPTNTPAPTPTATLPPANTPAPVQPAALSDILNNYMAQTGNNLSVAVYDIRRGQTHYSTNAYNSYPAWGFYIPVYLAYKSTGYASYSTQEAILGPDANYSNSNGNTAINAMGGISGLNSILRSRFGASTTVYNKLFGQSSSYGNNYTSAYEACTFLQKLASSGDYGKLRYNLPHFGIYAPSGATVYAHAGTENNAKRQYLNFYGVITGYNSQYCVAIMTKGYTGSNITSLLSAIHNHMEKGGN